LNNKTSVFIFAISIALIAFGYWYEYSQESKISRSITVTHCQINKSECVVDIGKNRVLKLSISPLGIPQTQPLLIEVFLQGVEAEEVSVNFEGVEINHHLLPYTLTKQSKNHFKGKGFISLCSLRKMNWLANIIVNSDDETLKVSFPFETVKN